SALGQGSLEKPSGVDLYVNVTRRGQRERRGKAFLVQAKKGLRSDPRLLGQCQKMQRRSERDSYVWVYTGDGTRVIDASMVVSSAGMHLPELPSYPPRELFARVLKCCRGDRNIGLDVTFDETDELN